MSTNLSRIRHFVGLCRTYWCPFASVRKMSDEKNFKCFPFDNFLDWAVSAEKYIAIGQDINEKAYKELAEMTGKEHLSEGSFFSPFPVNGVIRGANVRFLIPLICRLAEMPNEASINVWFLMDTASPYTFVTEETKKSLFGFENLPTEQFDLAIQDPTNKIECHTSFGDFKEVNILGSQALRQLKLSIVVDWDNDKFQLLQK